MAGSWKADSASLLTATVDVSGNGNRSSEEAHLSEGRSLSTGVGGDGGGSGDDDDDDDDRFASSCRASSAFASRVRIFFASTDLDVSAAPCDFSVASDVSVDFVRSIELGRGSAAVAHRDRLSDTVDVYDHKMTIAFEYSQIATREPRAEPSRDSRASQSATGERAGPGQPRAQKEASPAQRVDPANRRCPYRRIEFYRVTTKNASIWPTTTTTCGIDPPRRRLALLVPAGGYYILRTYVYT